MSSLPLPVLRLKYEKAAREYARNLPLEHYMEAIAQATQRKITLESLDLVHARRPEVQVFNELLVQYPLDDDDEAIGQIVPDNMVVVWKEPIQAEGSYNLPLQPTRPYWVLEYVSKHNHRKDYETNLAKYEQELKVPYYLLFIPDAQEMNLFRLVRGRYVSVRANRDGRFPIAKLDLEVAMSDGWVRFWFEGKLLPLPADLQRELEETRRELAEERRRANREARRADEQTRRADEQTHRADELAHRAEEERQARLAAEEELTRLRAQLERSRNE